jgi:thymidylate synthase (FAD)
MKTIKQSYEILFPSANYGCEKDGCEFPNARFIREAKLIELAGRTAYKSEDKISDTSYDAFIRGIIKRGHEAVIEFGTMEVKFTTNRGVTHELVRHRLCSFLQESTRYCNYSKDNFDNEITVIEPATWNEYSPEDQQDWRETIEFAEKKYLAMIARGRSPQQARGILPNDLKTEICVRTNFREWRQIFRLRCASNAHPDIRTLMIPLRDECVKKLSCVFSDLLEKEKTNE